MTVQTLVTADRIDGFISKLAQRKSRAHIRAICLGERNFLKNAKFVKRGLDPKDEANKSTLAIATRHKLLTRYRAAIVERFGPDHPALEYMVLSDEEQDARNEHTRATIVAKHTSRRPIDADAHIGKAIEILEAVLNGGTLPALKIAAALIAVTGRRPIEILQCGEFKKAKAPDTTLFDSSIAPKKRWALVFAGQAKTRGADSAQNEPYEIPVLAPPALIQTVFTALRKRYNLQGLTSEQVGNRTSKELGQYAKEVFRDREGGTIGPKQLRAAYATIAYEFYAPEKLSWNVYTARILGHSVNDLVTSFSYDQFYPVGSKREYDRAIRNATRETLDALREQRRREPDETRAGYIDEKIANVTERLEATA